MKKMKEILPFLSLYKRASDIYENVTDFILFYLSCFFLSTRPIRKSGHVFIKDMWVVHYDILFVEDIDIESEIKKTISKNIVIFESGYSSILRYRSDKVDKDMINMCIDTMGIVLKAYINFYRLTNNRPTSNNFLIKKLKLQELLEYKTEQRDLLIKEILEKDEK